MRLVTLPGVYRPRDDTAQLASALRAAGELRPGSRVLELCTGTGAVAVGLAREGHEVTAVDVSRRAVLNVRLNALLNGVEVEALRGDLFAPVAGRRFDAIVANPPYVPAPPGAPHHGPARAWNAGADGRLILNRICADAAQHLAPDGTVLLIQSSLANVDATCAQLGYGGLTTDVVLEEHVPLGPIAAARAAYLREQGYCGGDGHETMTVVRARAAQHRGMVVATDRAAAQAA